MGKILSKYRAYTPTAMKNRASIPSAADITEHANDIECWNISLNAVKNILGAVTYSLYDLCRHASVNVWSAFGPTVRTVVAGLLTNSVPTVCRLGDFAGYNHTAVAPHFDIGGTHEDEWVIPSDTVVFHCKIDIGEILYTDIVGRENDAAGVAYSIWDGSTYIDSRVKALSGLTNIADFDYAGVDRIELSDLTETKEYTQKIEIIDSADTYDYSGTHIICQLAELANWVKHIHACVANFVYLSANSHWAFEGTAPTFNNQGHLVFQALSHHDPAGVDSNVAHVEVTAYVEVWDGVTGTTITSVHSLYHGGPVQTIGPINHHVWETSEGAEDLPLTGTVLGQYKGLNIGYGYRCVVFVNEHPA